MSASTHHRIRKRLAAASLAIGTTNMPPAVASTEALVELVAGGDAVALEEDERLSLLALLSVDSRAVVRARAASALHVAWRAPDEAAAVLQGLVSDPDEGVRLAASDGLAALLAATSPVARVELVCRWSVSPVGAEREAIARALVRSTPVLVADVAIEQLAQDELPRVRVLAARAAAAHYAEDPATYRRLLVGLAMDADEQVRAAVRETGRQ